MTEELNQFEMKKIDKPLYSSTQALNLCIKSKESRIANADLVNRLKLVRHTVSDEEIYYIEKADEQSLFSVETQEDIDGVVTIDEMKNLYEKTFVRSKYPRKIYNSIISSPDHGTCPYCFQRKVSTIDHYLPKDNFPVFAISPINLLPSCPVCNTKKSNYKTDVATNQLIHPYFDETNDGRWLYADVIEIKPIVIIFKTNCPEEWPVIKRKRIENHFDFLKLGELYSCHSGSEIAGMSFKLEQAFAGGGAHGVRLRLSEDAESWFKYHKNCWQAAMYEALSLSEWFCSGGFAE